MKFYGCPLWHDTIFDFFKWNSWENFDVSRFQIIVNETTIVEIEHEKSSMDEKIKKLQIKKENVEEELQELKFEPSQVRIGLMKSARNERNLSMALLFHM
ncbi:Serine--tRNA ligase, partial [Bienertia sinuspersici]